MTLRRDLRVGDFMPRLSQDEDHRASGSEEPGELETLADDSQETKTTVVVVVRDLESWRPW